MTPIETAPAKPREAKQASVQISRADLRRFAPSARDDYVDAIVGGQATLSQHGINTPLRLCHFLAQASHETGGFTIVREYTTWSAKRMCELWPHRYKLTDPVFRARYLATQKEPEQLAELAYGYKVRPDLGNCEEGDGWAYRGGGIFQGTGRSWYRETGRAIGIDLEGNPEAIEDPRVSLLAAAWYWQRYGLSRFADHNYGRAIGNQINRGSPYSRHQPIGAREREREFARAWAIWGTGELPNPLDLHLGAYGAAVKEIQERMRELKFPIGAVDQVYGPEMARAVAAFKADWKRAEGVELEPDDWIGVRTRAAMLESEPIQRPEREEMTAKELRERGSTEAAAGHHQQQVAWWQLALGGAGAAGYATNTTAPTVSDPTAAVESALAWVPKVHGALVPAVSALTWAIANFWWVGIILGAVWYWNGGARVVAARLKAARDGINLSK